MSGTKESVPILPRIIIIGLVLLVSCCGVQPADAQDNRLYVGVSGMWSTQQGSTTPIVDPDTPAPSVGGTAFGMVGEVGIFLKPMIDKWTFSLSFEFSVPARFDSVQVEDYPESCVCLTDNRHRDLVFSGLFHVHAPQMGPIRLGLVAGPSIIDEDTLQRTASAIVSQGYYTADFGPLGPETQLTRLTVGLTFGADIGLQVSRRIQIVPQIRLHWANRSDLPSATDASAFLGLGPLIVRPSIGIRVSF
jgi:hypothetical protein